jgi:hypothetical protein
MALPRSFTQPPTSICSKNYPDAGHSSATTAAPASWPAFSDSPDPALWKPLGPSVTVFRGQPLSSISPDQIVQTILQESPKALYSAQAD